VGLLLLLLLLLQQMLFPNWHGLTTSTAAVVL